MTWSRPGAASASARRPKVDRPTKPQPVSRSIRPASSRFQGGTSTARKAQPNASASMARPCASSARMGARSRPPSSIDLRLGRRVIGVGEAVLQDGGLRDWRRSARGRSPRATPAPPRAPAAARGARPARAGAVSAGWSRPASSSRHHTRIASPRPAAPSSAACSSAQPVTARSPERRQIGRRHRRESGHQIGAARGAVQRAAPAFGPGRARHARSIAPASACGVNSLSHTTSAKPRSTRRSARVLCSVSVAVSNGTRTIGLSETQPLQRQCCSRLARRREGCLPGAPGNRRAGAPGSRRPAAGRRASGTRRREIAARDQPPGARRAGATAGAPSSAASSSAAPTRPPPAETSTSPPPSAVGAMSGSAT